MSDTPRTDACPAERIEGLCVQLELELNEWRECADKLVDAFRGVPYDPFTVGSFNAQKCKRALTDYKRLKEICK
jgi:hypothetical protein